MIILGLGANLSGEYGSPLECLAKIPEFLQKKGIQTVNSSNVWKSAPVPISDQPWYHNAIIEIDTDKSPQELLTIIAEIEVKMGRVRNQKNEARIIDIDIISYNDEIIVLNNLNIPHERMSERAFVLFPLQEISPDWQHPATQKKIKELIEELPSGQEIKIIPNSVLI